MTVIESLCQKKQAAVVHPTAIVDKDAILEPGVHVGPYAIVGPMVHIGEGTIVEPFAQIKGPTIIGRFNKIRSYSFIGCDTQDKKFTGGESRLLIGDHNDIREYTTVSRGNAQPEGLTQIGSYNLLMAYTHIAHDCIIGSHNILANNTSLAGHVVVGDYVRLGGFTGVHQFCRIGSYSCTGGASVVLKDLCPYTLAAGQPLRLLGLNIEGLKRRDFSSDQIAELKNLYRILLRQSLCIRDTALQLLSQEEIGEHEKALLQFILDSAKGVVR